MQTNNFPKEDPDNMGCVSSFATRYEMCHPRQPIHNNKNAIMISGNSGNT